VHKILILDANLIRVAAECDDTSTCLFVSWHSWPQRILSKMIKECVRKKEKLRFGISYLICVPPVLNHTVLMVCLVLFSR
jgi:hypothetical protein